MLPTILAEVKTPCLFWLDAHHAPGDMAIGDANTPIERELSFIFAHPLWREHVMLVDDGRYFLGRDGYPTIRQVNEMAKVAGYEACELKDDIIRIHGAAHA